MNVRVLLIVLVGLAAVVEDLSRRRISNWTSAGAGIGGLIVHAMNQGWLGVWHAALGAVIGFGVFLVFYLLGGMGGGDVKLMAGFGALLGDGRIFQAALLAAIAGGLMAMGYLAVRTAARWVRAGQPMSGWKGGESIPYAPAIAVGVWLALASER